MRILSVVEEIRGAHDRGFKEGARVVPIVLSPANESRKGKHKESQQR